MTQEFIDKLIERISDKVAEKVAEYLMRQNWGQAPRRNPIYPLDNVTVMYGVPTTPYTGDLIKTEPITSNLGIK